MGFICPLLFGSFWGLRWLWFKKVWESVAALLAGQPLPSWAEHCCISAWTSTCFTGPKTLKSKLSVFLRITSLKQRLPISQHPIAPRLRRFPELWARPQQPCWDGSWITAQESPAVRVTSRSHEQSAGPKALPKPLIGSRFLGSGTELAGTGAEPCARAAAPHPALAVVLARVPVPQFPPLLHEKLWYMWILRKSQVVMGKKWGVFFLFLQGNSLLANSYGTWSSSFKIHFKI